MEILFISDYVCPYCLVAKQALKEALEAVGISADIRWQPYELTPEPLERVDTYHDERRRAGYRILEAPAAALGLDMKLPPAVIPRPYTRLAFEGWYYACDHGCGEAYNDLMYRAYFIEEQDIGKPDVLAALAQRLGLDGADFAAALERGDYRQQEQEAVRYAREVLKPKGVPTLYIDGQEVHLSDYTRQEMIGILNDAGSASSGFFCGPDGC